MAEEFRLNALTGKLDLVEMIPQLDSDPASPVAEEAWVRKSGGAVVGGGVIKGWIGLGSTPILTAGAGDGATYAFRYRTKEGTTVGVALS